MPTHEALSLRDLTPADLSAVQRILETSEYTHYRFSSDELPALISRLPAVGAFAIPLGALARVTQGTLRAFLLINWLVPPSAWIGGFGVQWGESAHYADYLHRLLPLLADRARQHGAHTLYYSGSDFDMDWLRDTFESHDFHLVSLLRSYDKEDYAIPSEGNQQIRVRPFTPADIPGVVAVENLTFDQLWRHDAASFLEVAATYPYFVVAEDDHGIAGYQFNIIDAATGYLVRIAVHPRVAGHGIGTRLMAEAVHYFHRHNVWKIVLNTEEDNTRAHRLYEWFGFHRIPARGFVLAHDLTTPSLASSTP